MYTHMNFKTKKALKEAVEDDKVERELNGDSTGVTIYQPGGILDPPEADHNYTGIAYLEGPHYPAPHTWWAEVQMIDGVVVKVR